jgi:murein DD-endopeptidase MepM/ murein hydrolase activator NlpD
VDRAMSFRESASATKGKPRATVMERPLGRAAMIEDRCPLVRPGSSVAASACPGSYHQQHRRSSAPLGLLAPLLLGISDIAPARDGGRSDYGTSQRVDHLMGCPLRRIDYRRRGHGGSTTMRLFWLQGVALTGLILGTGLTLIAGAQAQSRQIVQGAAVPAHPRAATQLRGANVIKPRASQALASLRAQQPVHGPINSHFGTRRSFWRTRFHKGIDIGARPGTPVQAPAAGTVTSAGPRSGYGKTIMIDHGHGLQTLYGHLSKVAVKPGQKVERGAMLGLTGVTGNASGPHLHYEILVNGRPADPRGSMLRSGDMHSKASRPGGWRPRREKAPARG